MYTRLVTALETAYAAAKNAEIEDQALSKSISDILLANHLGHWLTSGGQGADAIDAMGRKYEYKCNTGNRIQCIFNLGANRGLATNIAHVRKKFSPLEGIYYAQLQWGEVREVAYIPTINFLPALEAHIEHKVKGGLLAWNLPWDAFLRIPGARLVSRAGVPSYPNVAAPLIVAHAEASNLKLDMGLFAKGAHNHLFLAHRERHEIPVGGHQGHDARDSAGGYEYKISATDIFNFHFGARKSSQQNQKLIEAKCNDIVAAYCASRSYAQLKSVYRIPSADLLRLLLAKEKTTKGGQMNLQIARSDIRPFLMP
jgi:hypothetical protein